jgi:hypothetical protein
MLPSLTLEGRRTPKSLGGFLRSGDSPVNVSEVTYQKVHMAVRAITSVW